MAQRINSIFDTKRAIRSADDVVGRFRSGMSSASGRPMAISEWRVTVSDPEVASEIHRLYGGTPPQSWNTQSDQNLEVMTEASSVKVILDSADAVRSGLVLWSRQNTAVRRCDGVTQSDGSACVCPADLAQRKQAAKDGTGCDISISVDFRLLDAPDLGRWRFQSSSWSLASEIGKVQDEIDRHDGPVIAELSLLEVNYQTKTGQARNYTRPVVKIVGPYVEAGDE